MRLQIGIAAFLLIFTFSQKSFAYESETESYGYGDIHHLKKKKVVRINESDATRVQKFEAALDTLGIPLEPAPDFSNFVHANEVNQAEVQAHLPSIDPEGQFTKYLSIVNGNLQMFRDFFKSMISLDYLEYQQTLSTDSPSNDSNDLMQRLKAIGAQAQDANNTLPLQGLKIAIDPGHMGGDFWDDKTGKHVTYDGKKVSEGDLNLWTALLTAKKLEALGATVMLTRDKAGTVTTDDMNTFDITPYVQNNFYSSMDGWMAPYLENYSIDEVRKNIKNAPEVARAHSRSENIQQYFIEGADLEARSKMIDAFNPDITLDIHYDALDNTTTQNTTQSLEAFIPGSFLQNETGARKAKAQALKHLLEVRRWNQTVDLADAVTLSMSDVLKIPRYSEVYKDWTHVRDGVYGRNLYITRRALSSLMVYLECLHYDYESEFKNLTVLDQSGTYHDTSFQYPNRLDTVSDGIQNGFLTYFKNLKLQ